MHTELEQDSPAAVLHWEVLVHELLNVRPVELAVVVVVVVTAVVPAAVVVVVALCVVTVDDDDLSPFILIKIIYLMVFFS